MRQSNPMWRLLSRHWPNARYRALFLKRRRGQERKAISIECLDRELLDALALPHFGFLSTSDNHLHAARNVADRSKEIKMRAEVEAMLGLVPPNVDIKRLGYLSAMLANIYELDQQAVRTWMATPSAKLGNQCPVDLIDTPSGLEVVIAEVERLLSRKVVMKNIKAFQALKDR
ncbi:MbcA/ParS/Xre antitoxin family protein [Paramagnetospirillum kuznetsovii]|uniref:MbcA/ParS/Xre antitoxin family protein n=1 Tax=Paramagnetospirillum kuznetsovii TaxID=2053833 RepID=UPI001374C01C|nr:MbcA/ParS/Xre antitoxin family protein [Paramagnetospirillum kuznetsovii]